LRGFLFLANEGRIRRRPYEEQLNPASCLNLVTNAVVLWNTAYMKAVLDQLQAVGQHVDDVGVAHLSPARYAHLNPYGRYRFKVEVQKTERLSASSRFRCFWEPNIEYLDMTYAGKRNASPCFFT